MEYCSAGNLYDIITSKIDINLQNISIIMKKLFSACSYIHSKGIAHLDLKPENIFFTSDGELKLISFSLS